MTFNPRARLRYDFDAEAKRAITLVLAKFDDANPIIARIAGAVAIPGTTTLHADEALMLAGLLLPWHAGLSRRMVEHPSFAPEEVADAQSTDVV